MIKKWALRKDYDAILRVVPNEGDPIHTDPGKSERQPMTNLQSIEEEELDQFAELNDSLHSYQEGTEQIMSRYDILYHSYIKSESQNKKLNSTIDKMQMEIDRLNLQN